MKDQMKTVVETICTMYGLDEKTLEMTITGVVRRLESFGYDLLLTLTEEKRIDVITAAFNHYHESTMNFYDTLLNSETAMKDFSMKVYNELKAGEGR